MEAADLFCGAGGTSTGTVQAARKRGIELSLIAVNHWPRAVETHARNHPWARHLCADLGSVEASPNKLVPGGKLDLLVASPECTHHSNARGGKPCSDQSRASAWHVIHWLERLDVAELLMENVTEFAKWGPLGANGRPDKARTGETFRAWVAVVESLGYRVEWRTINAADYGSATTRKRLFVRASKRGAIHWPEATHAAEAGAGRKRWTPARDVIDWSLKGESIFGRKRPLKPKTLARIEAGLKKFGGEAFIAVLRGTAEGQAGSWAGSVDSPLKTISAGGIHAALCQPFLVEYHSPKRDGDQRVRSVGVPLPTATTENRFGLCEPFVLNTAHSGGDRVNSCDAPLGTIPAGHRGEFALCEPFIVQTSHTKTTGRGSYVKRVDEPLTTVTGRVEHALCEPFIVPMEHSQRSALRSVEDTLPTITTAKGGAFGLCEPFLTKYYGSAKGAKPVEEPLDTVTARDRFALVQPQGVDILFRMLQPHELAAAMGFHGYQFSGTKTDQVRQIGNAVSVDVAEALAGSVMDSMSGRTR